MEPRAIIITKYFVIIIQWYGLLVFGTRLLALRPSKNVLETQDEKHIHMNTPSTHNETIYTFRETEKMALAKERMGERKRERNVI